MSFRQIKSPALADRSIVSSKLDQSAVQGQSALTGMLNPADCFTLLYDVGSDSLKKIGADQFFGSFSTSDLPEGDKLYFTDAKAQAAVAQDISDAVATETTRASAAEQLLTTSLAAEASRATAAEGVNASGLASEITRATTRENAIESAYQSADAALSVRIDSILTNVDSDALNSLAEIVTAFRDADDILSASVIANSSAISNEITRATGAESTNATAIANETTRATNAEVAIQSALTSEIARATAAEGVNAAAILVNSGDIDTLETGLAAEITRAKAAEGVTATGLAAEITRATGAEAANAASIQSEITARTAADTQVRSDLTTAYIAADAVVQSNIVAEAGLRAAADSELSSGLAQEIIDRAAAVSAEAGLRVSGDGANATAISNEVIRATAAEGVNATAISNEVIRATAEESRIEAKVDFITANVDSAALDSLSEIVAAFQNADSDLSALVSSNTVAISTEAGTRASADAVLQSNITAEAGTRATADGTLQSNITAEAGLRVSGDAATLASAQADATSKANTAEGNAIAHADAQDTALIGDASVDGTVGNTITARIASSKTDANTYTDTKVSAEAATRLAADNSLSLRATNLEGRASDLETDMGIAQSDILTEVAARVAGDGALQSAITAETTRATAAEGVNAAAITAETTRATNAEGVNATAIATETTRATGVETGLRTDVNANTSGVAANAAAIQVEVTRAKAAETVNANAIAAETTARTSGDAANATAISNEITARAAGDLALRTDVDVNALDIIGLDSDLSSEIARATAAEGVNAAAIASEITRATAAEGLNATAIATETTRATGIEAGLRTDVDLNTAGVAANSTAIASEIVRAKAAEVVNANAISAEVIRATSIEGGLRTDVDTVTSRVDAIVGTSPETLDTLQEIVAAFEDADSDIQNIISANSGRLTVNEGDIDALETRAASLEVRATSVEGRASNLEASQAIQDGRLVANESDILGLQTKQGSDTLVTIASDLSGAVNELHTEMGLESSKVAILETEMDNVEGRASILETRADSLDSDVLVHAGRLTVNEGDIVSLETKVGTATLATTATNLAGAVNELHTQVDLEAGKVSVLQGEMDVVEGKVGTLEGEMNAVEAAQALHAGRLTVNEGDIDSLESKMGSGSFDTTAQTVIGSSNELHGEINAIEARVDSAEADILTNAAAISAESVRALGQETLIRGEFAAADAVVTTAYTAADAVVLASAKSDATTKANNAEAAAKIYADGLVTDEAVDRANADAVLQSAITAEQTARQNADATLSSRATALETEMTATQAGAGLAVDGSYAAPTGTSYLNASSSLKDASIKLDAAIDAEKTRALGIEGSLQTQITSEAASRLSGDSALQSSLSSEVARAVAAEGVLSTNVAANATAISNEATARQNADQSLQSQIDFITANTDSAALDSLTEIVAAFQSADGTITGLITQNQTDIATNATAISNEATARSGADTAIRGEFAAADTLLQTNIDNKVAKSGDTMSGVLNMGSNGIAGLADGSVASDAVNKGQLDAGLAAQHISQFDTSDLSEDVNGSNLYFTDARVHAAVSVTDVSGEGKVSVTDGVFSIDTSKSVLELSDVTDTTLVDKEGYVLRLKTDGSGFELVDPDLLSFSRSKRQVFNGDGAQTVFAIEFDVTEQNAMVFVGGVIQDPSVHYFIDVENHLITFNGAIPVGTQAVLVAQSITSVGVLDPGSVTLETLAPNVKVFQQGADIVVGTTPTTVSSFPTNVYRSAKYVVSVELNGEFETRECLVVHNGTNAYITEYGIIYTGNDILGDTDVRVVSGVVELTYQAVSAGAVVTASVSYIDV